MPKCYKFLANKTIYSRWIHTATIKITLSDFNIRRSGSLQCCPLSGRVVNYKYKYWLLFNVAHIKTIKLLYKIITYFRLKSSYLLCFLRDRMWKRKLAFKFCHSFGAVHVESKNHILHFHPEEMFRNEWKTTGGRWPSECIVQTKVQAGQLLASATQTSLRRRRSWQHPNKCLAI